MNVLLEKLLESAPLDEKDKYEIRQIFNIVNDDKKQNILKNFDYIVSSTLKIKQDLRDSQEILLWKAISNIERVVKQARNTWIKNATWNSISELKQIL